MTGLDKRAEAFARKLRSAPLGADDVTAEHFDGEAVVACDLPPKNVNRAQELAGGYGFQLVDSDARVTMDGTKRYTFRAWAGPGERLGSDDDRDGLGLPGGVR